MCATSAMNAIGGNPLGAAAAASNASANAAASSSAATAAPSIERLACPACGGPLPAAVDTTDTLTCDYCGTRIRIRRRPAAETAAAAAAKAAAPADDTPRPTTVTDPGTGKPLATVCLPAGWKIAKASLDATNPTNDYPFAPTFEATDGHGACIRYHSGEKYAQYDRWLSAQIAQFNPQVKQRPFATVEEFLDSFAMRYANAQVSVQFVGQCAIPQHNPVSPEEGRRNVLNSILMEINTAETYGNSPMKPAVVYFDSACRIYDVRMGGQVAFRMGIATNLEGVMCTANLPMPGFGGLGGLLGGGLLGGSLGGGLLGGLLGGKAANPASAQTPATPAPGPADSKFFAYNAQTNTMTPTTRAAFSAVSGFGAINWMARNIFTLLAPVATFDEALRGAFADVCSGVKISDYVYERWAYARQKEEQAIRQKTQQTLAQQQAQFQAMQAINRAQQAAFDSYNQAWWDRENASWAANRARDRAAAASSDRAGAQWSEAIRGVNTYVRPDGSEVEVSVAADTAWTNASGDVVAGSATFNPGGDWTQMNRKW